MPASHATAYARIASDPAFEKLTPSERINAILHIDSPGDQRFYTPFLQRDVKLVSITPQPGPDPRQCTAVFKFPVTLFYCNASDNLHGGAQSLIYDMLTSLTMQAIGRPGFWINGGVSRTLNVSYLRPAPAGAMITCEVEVTQAGKTMNLLRGVMKLENGSLVSTCEHHKAAVAVKKGWDAKL